MDATEAPSPAKRLKADKGVSANELRFEDDEADIMEERLKDAYPAPRGPLLPVVIREPEPGKLQPLPEVQGKGKEKVDEEQAAQRHTPATTEPSGLVKTSSLYAELGLTVSETDSDEEVSPETNAEAQEEGQSGTNPGDAGMSQTPSSHVQMDEEFTATAYPKVQENLKLLTEGDVRLEDPASLAVTLSSLQNLDKEISFTNQFLAEKSQEDEPKKTNTEAEVQSLVMVPIHQDTSIYQLETEDMSRIIREQIVGYIYKQEIDRKIEETVKEVVTASVQYEMRAPLRARFKDLPTSDMKEILLQRMYEEYYDKGHEDHRMAYEALQKSIIRDESEQFNADKAEERKKMKSKQDSPKTPPESPPPPPPSGASGASGTTGASNSAQDPLPSPQSPTTNPNDQSPGLAAPGSSKTAATTAYIAWITTTSRFEPAASSLPEDVFMHEESDFEAQDMVSDDEDIGIRHIPRVNLNQDWFKPLSEDERPATPEPAWSIPSSSLPTDDIGVFIDWFCKKQGITELTPEHLEGPAYEVVKAFHPDVIHLQFQKEECHKLLTNQVDDRLLRYNVSRPLLLGGPPGQVMIQTEFFFNRDLDYLRFGSKGDRLALSITKMKAAYYPDVGLEQMVPDQMWIEEECMYDIFATYGISHWWFKRQKFYIDRHSAETNRRAIVRTHMRILSVIRIEVFSIYGYDYMKKIVLRRADNQEYTIAENNFKDLYPSDFEDLYLLNLQGHLNHLPPRDKKILSTAVNLWIRNLPRWEATGLEFMHDYKILDSPRAVLFKDKYGMQMLMRFNEIHMFSDGTLQQIDEALDYRVKEFKVNKNNLVLNTRTWKALLVEEYAKETTDFYGEPNDDIFSVASRTSCVTQAGSPPSMCQTISNIDAHVEGEQIHESKQSSYKDGKVRYEFPRSRQSQRDLPRDNSLVSVEVLRYDYKRSNVNKGIVRTEMELVLEHTQQGTSNEVSDYIKMEIQIPRSSRVKFIATCSYSRLNDFITSRKNDPKLPQTLILTCSSVCQSDEVMN
ncbi:hypothetical protein Tco_0356379 [Tanacetum coccineum]